MDLSGLEYGPLSRPCEHSNEPQGSHKLQTISWLASLLSASQKELCSSKLDGYINLSVCIYTYTLQSHNSHQAVSENFLCN
jgi:hypothetical protein